MDNSHGADAAIYKQGPRQGVYASEPALQAGSARRTPFHALHDVMERLDQVESRLLTIAARLAGTFPLPALDEPKASGDGIFHALEVGAQTASSRLDRMNGAMSVIESNLP